CGDTRRGARAPACAQLVPLPRPAYAARTVQTPLGAVEGSPGSLTLRCARVLDGEGGQSSSPAWVTVGGGRIVATGSGAPPVARPARIHPRCCGRRISDSCVTSVRPSVISCAS